MNCNQVGKELYRFGNRRFKVWRYVLKEKEESELF